MSAIKAGDLVMVVRGVVCCGTSTKMNGVPFVVAKVETRGPYCCKKCGHEYAQVTSAYSVDGCNVDVRRLIRIDPPALPESVDTEQEVTA